jgi:hypothetical protein
MADSVDLTLAESATLFVQRTAQRLQEAKQLCRVYHQDISAKTVATGAANNIKADASESQLSKFLEADKRSHDAFHTLGQRLIQEIKKDRAVFWSWRNGMTEQVMRRSWSLLLAMQSPGLDTRLDTRPILQLS